jgi:hypothetical protein
LYPLGSRLADKANKKLRLIPQRIKAIKAYSPRKVLLRLAEAFGEGRCAFCLRIPLAIATLKR